MSRILIAGGGVGGLEAMIALRRHLGADAEIHVLDGSMALVERQLGVLEPFNDRPVPSYDLAALVAEHGATLRPDRLLEVHVDEQRVTTVRGDVLDYDALLVAVGARTDVAIPGAFTFTGHRDVPAFRRLLEDLVARRIGSVAFAVPPGVTWALPLYELALLTAEHLHLHGVNDARLVLVTPERYPLEAFGIRISSRVQALLSQRRLVLRTDVVPRRVGLGGLEIEHRDTVEAERVVSLPRLDGPWISGLPHDARGFIPIDELCAVVDAPFVWAAGDGTTFPIKQGGIAAQQADVAAAAIAAHLGASVRPEPFHPVLKAILLDPRGAHYLEESADKPSDAPLWWPPTKVAAEHLAPYLNGAPGGEADDDEEAIEIVELLRLLAGHHEAIGDHELARECAAAAKQLAGSQPTSSRRSPSL